LLRLLQCDKKEGGYGGWDDKDDAQYEVLYKPADENDVKNNYDQKDNYDFKDDYDDDECTAGEREECCTANEKKQWQICTMLGCNPKKVSTVYNLSIFAHHLYMI